MRVREVGCVTERTAKRIDRVGEAVHRLQGEAQVVPRRRMVGLQRQRATIRGDRILVAIERGEDEPQVVVELGFARDQRRGALQQGKGIGKASPLIQHDAEVVQCQGLSGVGGERSAIRALGGVDVAAAVRLDALLRK